MKLHDEVRQAFGDIFVGSIGPVTSDELRSHGIAPDFEPSHPKMGFLVNEAAERSAAALEAKKNR
jgi:uroporphyrinogen-III synthase